MLLFFLLKLLDSEMSFFNSSSTFSISSEPLGLLVSPLATSFACAIPVDSIYTFEIALFKRFFLFK